MADENKSAFTPEQTEALTAMMGQQVNSIFTARLATVEKKILEKVTGSIGETLGKQLPELLAQHLPKPADPNDDGKNGKNSKTTKVDDVELATIKRRLDESEQRSRLFEEKANQERAKNRVNALNTVVTEQLAGFGIDAPRARAALALLKSEGRIDYQDEDSDNIVFRGDEGVALDLAIGLRQWSKTEDAKIFLPPKGAGGSGSRPGGGSPGANGGKLSREQQVSVLGDLLDRNL